MAGTNNQITDPIDAQEVRNRILDVALDVFSRKDYRAVRLEEIVAEAHSSHGAVFFHFPNKERIFLALVDQLADLLERRVTEAIEQETSSMDRVRVALETCLDTFGHYRRAAKILLVQAVGLGTVFEAKRNQVTERFAHLIETYLQEAVDDHEIDAVDVQVISLAWMGAIYALVIRWINMNEPEPQRIIASLVPALLKSVGYER
jgi:AcrR family transcriptional regulator